MIAIDGERSCAGAGRRDRFATLAIALECPVETRGVTEAGQTLSTGRGPEIRHKRASGACRHLASDPVEAIVGDGLGWLLPLGNLSSLRVRAGETAASPGLHEWTPLRVS